MKITVVCDVPNVENNGIKGSEKFLIEALKERGHEIVEVCCDEGKRGEDGCFVLTCRDGEPLSREDKNRLESLVWDSDIVWILYPAAVGRAALTHCIRHRIPAIWDFPLRTNRQYRYLYARFCRHMSAVRYPSETLRERFEDRFEHRWKSFVIPFGTDEGTLDRLEEMLYSIR